MSEIHIRTSQRVYLDLHGGNADALPVATVTNSRGVSRDLEVVQDSNVPGVTERYYVTLNMADTQDEGELTVEWVLTMGGVPVEKTDTFEVVTPYLTRHEVKAVWPEATDDEAVDVERMVRHIINAHTGQSFGYKRNATFVVEAHGESALRLPQRLIELKGISTLSAILEPTSAIVTSDGWYLKKGWSHEVTAISNNSQYWGGGSAAGVPANDHDDDGVWTLPVSGEPGYEKTGHGKIITAPGYGTTPTPWRDDYPFKITGDWGYKSVPIPVKEAARLLVNDYACNEATYRDRYLESIKAADWRLQFNSRSWEYTGNVRADQLLAEYVMFDWAVI